MLETIFYEHIAFSTGAKIIGVFQQVRGNKHCVIHKFFCIKIISKAVTQFCRDFGNVVNHAFLVQIFWAKNAVGATFYAF